MSPTNNPPRASRWVGTRMFGTADATLNEAAATTPSNDVPSPDEATSNTIPRQRSQSFGVNNIPGVGQGSLDGTSDFQPRPEHCPSHFAHHQPASLHPLREGTHGAAMIDQCSAHMRTQYADHQPQPSQRQWAAGMASQRRSSTGDWRDRHNPAHPFAFPHVIDGPHQPPSAGQWGKSSRNSFGLGGIVEEERPSYASALKGNDTPEMPHMGRGRPHNSLDWRPIDWSKEQALPFPGTTELVNPRNKPLLSIETTMPLEGPQSGSSSGSPHSGRRIDLGNFRPSRMKEEQRGLVATPTGSNYLGNKQSRRQAPRNPEAPNEDNCALWLTNIPPDLTLRGFLALVNTGEVFAVVFSPAKPPSWTQAVKLVFKTHEAAERFLNQVRSQQGIVVGGMRMEGIWNRNWYPEDRSPKTRVLQIESPVYMTFKTWHDYFDECVVYQIEEEFEVPCSVPGKRIYEFRFARIDGQSEAVFQAIAKNSKFTGLHYKYSADPCDPNSGLR